MVSVGRENVLALSATDLALCQRCPRLLAYKSEGKRNAWKVGIEGSGERYGSLFHTHIAEAFFKDMGDAAAPGREAMRLLLSSRNQGLNEGLSELIRTHYFNPFLAARGKELKADRLVAMAGGTALWVRDLAAVLEGIPSLRGNPEAVLPRVFPGTGRTLEAFYAYEDGIALRVTGRYDALIFNPDSGGACLFEFKGYRPTDSTVGLSQSLVYAWLVERATGVLPSVRLVYLEGGEPFAFSEAEVASILRGLPPLFEAARGVLLRQKPLGVPASRGLCSHCPWGDVCDRDWGDRDFPLSAGAAPLSDAEEPHDEGEKPQEESRASEEAEGRERMEQLLRTLEALRISVIDEGFVCGPCFVRLKVRPDAARGTTVRKIEARMDDLQVQMDLPAPPMIQAQGGYVAVDIARSRRQVLSLETLIRRGEVNRPRSEAAFPLGMRVDGRVLWADLAEPAMTSVLIGGTSGSGKSVLLRSVVVGLLRCAPQDSVRFTLIDPKRVTFSDLAELRALEEGRVLCDAGEAMEALGAAVDEMERRYGLMEEARVSHLTDYNAVSGERLRRRVVIVDEYADLITHKETAKELEQDIQRLCQKGRAAGFHLLLATQRPDAKVVTGVIKANLQLRVALKVASKSNSQIILGEGFTQAQCLLGHGDMLVGDGSYVERLQAPIADVALLAREAWNR